MKNQLGQLGEQITVDYLKSQGFSILACNYKKFYGEIDIIAQKQNILAFVEVKTRKSTIVSMHELISPAKQSKIVQVAYHFISTQQNLSEQTIYRFDVALIHAQQYTQDITYIPNAFQASVF